jgi:biopolymer transport protein ExbD
MALCLIAAFAAGCLSPNGTGVVDVSLDANGTLRVEEKPIVFDRLADAVRSAGATRETRIEVALPPDARDSDIQRITRLLSRGGFPKIVFKKTRPAEARVEPLR